MKDLKAENVTLGHDSDRHAHDDHNNLEPEGEAHNGHHESEHERHEKYAVEIEGREYPWSRPTITVSEIRDLGHLPADQPIIEIDPDNIEHQLDPDAVVILKHGHCYGKKPRFKRGSGDRMSEELALLRRHFPQAEQHGSWIRIPGYLILAPYWSRESGTVSFEAPTGYPGNPPYSFYIEGGLRLKVANGVPQNYQEPAATPFPGIWGKFSWSQDGNWKPTADVVSGNNLLNFVSTFADRFQEAL